MSHGRAFIFFARPKKMKQKKGLPATRLFPTRQRAFVSRLVRASVRVKPQSDFLSDCPSRRAAEPGRVKGRNSLTARRAAPDITVDIGQPPRQGSCAFAGRQAPGKKFIREGRANGHVTRLPQAAACVHAAALNQRRKNHSSADTTMLMTIDVVTGK